MPVSATWHLRILGCSSRPTLTSRFENCVMALLAYPRSSAGPWSRNSQAPASYLVRNVITRPISNWLAELREHGGDSHAAEELRGYFRKGLAKALQSRHVRPGRRRSTVSSS